MYLKDISYRKGLKHTARGPHAPRENLLCRPRRTLGCQIKLLCQIGVYWWI